MIPAEVWFNAVFAALVGSSIASLVVGKHSRVLSALVLPLVTVSTLLLALTHHGRVELFSGLIVVDMVTVILALLASSAAAFVAISAFRATAEYPLTLFHFLAPLSLLGVILVAASNDIAMLIPSWLLTTVASDLMVALPKDRASAVGAFKLVMMGLMSTCTLVYAVGLLCGETGATSVPAIASTVAGLAETKIPLLAILLLVVSASFKIGAFPFHGWVPSVFGAARPVIVAFLVSVTEFAPYALFLRLLLPVAQGLGMTWVAAISLLVILTETFGSFVALLQRDLQRLMAFAVIGDAGFVLTGLVPNYGIPYLIGMQGAVLEAFALTYGTLIIYLFLQYAREKLGSLTLATLSGAARSMPISASAAALALLNVVGFPPLPGFWGKLFVFLSVVEVAPVLLAVGLVNSVIAVAYSAIAIKYMFFSAGPTERLEKVTDPEVVIMILLTVLSVVLGLGPIQALVAKLVA